MIRNLLKFKVFLLLLIINYGKDKFVKKLLYYYPVIFSNRLNGRVEKNRARGENATGTLEIT